MSYECSGRAYDEVCAVRISTRSRLNTPQHIGILTHINHRSINSSRTLRILNRIVVVNGEPRIHKWRQRVSRDARLADRFFGSCTNAKCWEVQEAPRLPGVIHVVERSGWGPRFTITNSQRCEFHQEVTI